MDMPLRNQQPIQMERSPPNRGPSQAYGAIEDQNKYVSNIQSIENIQRQISSDSYGNNKQRKPSMNGPNENIFDLVNKRSDSQNSFRGISLSKNKQPSKQQL